MTIQQLQYILEVQRTGSASNAAKNLFVSQSAISTSISGMEAELGFPIFERTRRGMVPTLRGMHALEHAAKICASYEEMQQTCIVEKKQIRINSVDLAPFSDAFVQLINETKDRDDLQFLMNSGLGPDNAINQVAAGNLDLAVLLILPFAVAYKEEMIRRKGLKADLWTPVPAAIVIGPGHRLYGKRDVSPADFAEDAIVDRPAAAIVNSSYLKGLISINREKAILVADRRVRADLIRCGAAYAISAMSPVKTESADLRYIPLKDVTYTPILITNPAHPTPPEIIRYMELAREKMYTA